jgi:lipopolysaccharide export system protein LptA
MDVSNIILGLGTLISFVSLLTALIYVRRVLNETEQPISVKSTGEGMDEKKRGCQFSAVFR